MAAATFSKSKSRIQTVLEHNLTIIAPKLRSINLISDNDCDQAMDSSVDSKTRAAVLTNRIERKIVNYRSWWILVYVLLSSGIDAERTFFESLVVLPEQVSGDVNTQSHGSKVDTASMSPVPHSPMVETQLQSHTDSIPSEQTVTSSSGATPSGATSISESVESVPSQEDNATQVQETFSLESNVWYTHARDFPGIKFSNYYTKQVVTSMGNIIKGEGIELRIPGRAIKKGHSIEFVIQACIEGPFELPDNISLATPVFLIKPHYEFQKAVTLLMDAFISLESRDQLVFLTSPAKPQVDKDGLHWDFTINEAMPQITDDNCRIVVEVARFCLLCFGIKRGELNFMLVVLLCMYMISINY